MKPDYTIFSHAAEESWNWNDDIDIDKDEQTESIIHNYLKKIMDSGKFTCFMMSTDKDGNICKQAIITYKQYMKIKETNPIFQLCLSLIEDKRLYTSELYELANE